MELKPCPFCGGKAELYAQSDYEGYFYDLCAFCNDCGVIVEFYTDVNCITVDDFPKEEVEKAIEAWNRREEND